MAGDLCTSSPSTSASTATVRAQFAGPVSLSSPCHKAAYTGPCPPGGAPHHYRFTVYALQRRADVGADASPEAAIQAIEAAATARGRLVGTFGR
jgi:phosphatidylethanolamine-binding protein (PEBP) family uncharacterized protein